MTFNKTIELRDSLLIATNNRIKRADNQQISKRLT